jgi:hypothetical protein
MNSLMAEFPEGHIRSHVRNGEPTPTSGQMAGADEVQRERELRPNALGRRYLCLRDAVPKAVLIRRARLLLIGSPRRRQNQVTSAG